MKSKLFPLIITAIFLTATSAAALDFGSNITISDGEYAGTGWNGDHEDQEVEPGNVQSSNWDLEGFFQKQSILTMVGGFDFKNGDSGWESGDIFIDIDGDADYGLSAFDNDSWTVNGIKTIKNSYGYDYVLDMDFAALTYTVFKIGPDTDLWSVNYRSNDGSNAYRFKTDDGGVLVDGYQDRTFSYMAGLSDMDTGFSGGDHNAVSVDIGFLAGIIPGEEFTAHFTIGCGNDNLMGKGTAPVPEPTTILLSGLGLLGMGLFLRRKQTQKLARQTA